MSDQELVALEMEAQRSKEALAQQWSALGHAFERVANDAQAEISHKVDQAKEAVSLSHHVHKRPWSLFAGAVLAGVVLSALSRRRIRFRPGSILRTSLSSGVRALVDGGALAGAAGFFSGGDGGALERTVVNMVDGISSAATKFVDRNLPAAIAPTARSQVERLASSLKSSSRSALSAPKRLINERGESIAPGA